MRRERRWRWQGGGENGIAGGVREVQEMLRRAVSSVLVSGCAGPLTTAIRLEVQASGWVFA